MNNQPDNHTKSFAHVLVFKCPDSGDPIGASLLSSCKNLEEVDGHAFKVKCECGWMGEILGINRVNSWVENWK
jgi:hypothetical protein